MGKAFRDLHPWESFLVSVVTWILAVILTAFFSLAGILLVFPVTKLLGFEKRRAMHWISVAWAKVLLRVHPLWRIKVDGLEHLERERHYLFVANHQSLLDIVVAASRIPHHFKFMAKKELFSVPLMGWHMRLAGYIPIDRGRRESAKKALGQVRDWLRKDVSVLFYPEGTRSLDGDIQAFKTGAFKTAIEEQVPIVPVVIEGTGEVTPKHSWLFRKAGTIHVSFLEPLSANNPETGTVDSLRESVRSRMIERLSTIRQTMREPG